ncbi:MAG: glutamine-hydrolyzing GMP synthase [Thermoguttaceae bacterium]
MAQIIVVDTGGQYCHLIARRVREAGVQPRICAPEQALKELRDCKGLIISGGPRSVYAADAIHCPAELFQGQVPVLGICYGHQLMAHALGGVIRPGADREFGEARLTVLGEDTILRGVPQQSIVWMSHGDEVFEPPPSFEVLARTEHCRIAAMTDQRRGLFGLQFHPEVTHTPAGGTILRNFLFGACHCTPDWSLASQVAQLQQRIRAEVAGRKVLFFVSGGVDSTVAFALCSQTLGPERVQGVFVDTGFMRKGERRQIEAAFDAHHWHNIRFVDARDQFVAALDRIAEPERKRLLIGNCFLDVQRRVAKELELDSGQWMLGQGTIYPDTIESGGTKNAATIKTHHNRVPAIEKLIRAGLLLEPLTAFYKDEVREIGEQLGLPQEMVYKHPFPGPGLAVRCLCAEQNRSLESADELRRLTRESFGLDAVSIPLRTVGVQGDYRSYSNVVLLSGAADLATYGNLATKLTNQLRSVNRVTFLVGTAPRAELCSAFVRRSFINTARLDLLREADALANGLLVEAGLARKVWQFPVVLLPLSFGHGETVALRPVLSTDAMTATYADLPMDLIREMAHAILALPGVDAVLYDVTSKPPATIEWE